MIDWLAEIPEAKLRLQENILNLTIGIKNKKQQMESALDDLLFEDNLTNFYVRLGVILSLYPKEIESMQNRLNSLKLIDRMHKENELIKAGHTFPDNYLTQSQIETARQFPIEQYLYSAGITIIKNKIHCLFHDEKTPSMHVYPDKVHCFGCDATADVIDLVMKIENKSFKEAVRSLL